MAEKLELIGVLYRKMETQRVTEKLDRRDFVIKTEEEYPQIVKFELMNDKTMLIERFAEGDKVKVSFNVRGREWKKDDGAVVYFNSLQAWRIELLATGQTASHHPPMPPNPAPKGTPPASTPEDSDLPF